LLSGQLVIILYYYGKNKKAKALSNHQAFIAS